MILYHLKGRIMRSFAAPFIVVLLAGTSAPAAAQVTQTYQYDGHGRLTGVTTSGAGGTNSAVYAYDRANNRISRSQTGATAWAALLQLPANQFLQPNEALVSPDGRYSFALRPSGELELWLDDVPDMSGSRALAAAFGVTEDGQAQFAPSLPSATANAWVALRNDGDLALLDEAGGELWRSSTVTGREAAQ